MLISHIVPFDIDHLLDWGSGGKFSACLWQWGRRCSAFAWWAAGGKSSPQTKFTEKGYISGGFQLYETGEKCRRNNLKENFFVMFDIQECFRYKTRYKDAPGFMPCGKVGTALRFYGSVLNEHSGYCLEFSTGSGVGYTTYIRIHLM